MFDALGRPVHYDADGRPWAWDASANAWVTAAGMQPPQAGYAPPAPPPVAQGPRHPAAGAKPVMPDIIQMGGTDPNKPAWVRYPFFPTAPKYSTSPTTGHLVRRYSARLQATDADYAVGTESIRLVQFSLPARLVAINASSFNTANGNALPVGVSPRDAFRLRGEYTDGERLDINATLGSTIAGTAEKPGQLGDRGWTIGAGASFTLGITPLIDSFDVDVVLWVLEVRGSQDYEAKAA